MQGCDAPSPRDADASKNHYDYFVTNNSIYRIATKVIAEIQSLWVSAIGLKLSKCFYHQLVLFP